MSTKKNLTLITNELSYEERIQARIDAFRMDILSGDGNRDYMRDILAACHDYLMEYEDAEIYMSCFKIKEAIFYIDHFLDS